MSRAVEIAWIALALWGALALVHGLWRSRGEARLDPLRPPGPLDQV